MQDLIFNAFLDLEKAGFDLNPFDKRIITHF